jgi:hypothetical protein
MKNLIIYLLSSLLTAAGFAQSRDTILYESRKILLTQNLESTKYKLVIWDSTYTNLKFAKRIYSAFQILDANNQVYFIGDDGQITEDIRDERGYCGTVEYVSFSIRSNGDYIQIYKDVGFLGENDQNDADKIHEVSAQDADSVLFINGRAEFSYMAGMGPSAPLILILVKDGKYFLEETPHLKYDSIDFRHSRKTKRDNLYGLLGIVEPKFKKIEDFNYFLAKAETVNGEVVYIDKDGKEY